MSPITFRTTRDQARMLEQNFMPLMMRMADSRMRNHAAHQSKFMTGTMLYSLLEEVERKFKKKLLAEANKFSFKLKRHEAIAFYYFLMKIPIDTALVYAYTFRQHLCDVLHQQLFTLEETVHGNFY